MHGALQAGRLMAVRSLRGQAQPKDTEAHHQPDHAEKQQQFHELCGVIGTVAGEL
ncbi:MAG: hypothetical protein JHC95_15735 [Solirubrobacteraceae bacterium]|nr:hypothetical protein [Solirubrobacteraceae bacterium]